MSYVGGVGRRADFSLDIARLAGRLPEEKIYLGRRTVQRADLKLFADHNCEQNLKVRIPIGEMK